MSDAIRERVVKVLRDVLGPEIDVEHTRLELASLQILEVVASVETEFEVTIPEDAPLARLTSSVDNLVRFLEQLRS